MKSRQKLKNNMRHQVRETVDCIPFLEGFSKADIDARQRRSLVYLCPRFPSLSVFNEATSTHAAGCRRASKTATVAVWARRDVWLRPPRDSGRECQIIHPPHIVLGSMICQTLWKEVYSVGDPSCPFSHPIAGNRGCANIHGTSLPLSAQFCRAFPGIPLG